MSAQRLVADIGGTNARFALSGRPGEHGPVWSAPVGRGEGFTGALAAFLGRQAGPRPLEAAVAAAGPLDGDAIRLTNADWTVSRSDIERSLPGATVALFNDLEAVALALPHLRPEDLAPVGPDPGPRPGGRRLAVNVGTGFGAAVALALPGGGSAACPGEAGHMSLAVWTDEERAVFAALGLDRPVIEDVLSTHGFMELYRSLGGTAGSADTPGRLFDRFAGDDIVRRAVRLFTVWLGRAAGDLALATASWGGVYLTGGIVDSWRRVADAGLFREAFVGTRQMRPRMEAVPVLAILRPHAALLGLSRADLRR